MQKDQNVIIGIGTVKFDGQEVKFPILGEGSTALLLTDNAKLGAIALADAHKVGTLEPSSIEFVGEALLAVVPAMTSILGITPTEAEIATEAEAAYQNWATQLETAFALAALEQVAPPPAVETPAEEVATETATQTEEATAEEVMENAGTVMSVEPVAGKQVIANWLRATVQTNQALIKGNRALLAASVALNEAISANTDALSAQTDMLGKLEEFAVALEAGAGTVPALAAEVAA